MIKLLAVFGTRPEAIKMCPLIIELKKRKNFKLKVAVTGQHRSMLDEVLLDFNVIRDFDLSVMREGGSLSDISASMLSGVSKILDEERPDIVLVHGDTASAFISALAAFYMNIKVAHIEAGLRTYKIRDPFPEEFYRRAIALISDIHFAPTEKAKENLLSEGINDKNIYVTGNTVIDALRHNISDGIPNRALQRTVILTAHRRESIGEPLLNVFRAVRHLAENFSDIKIIYPVHENPSVKRAAYEELSGISGIELSPPIPVKKFHGLLHDCYMIMTDSGGIQEEASYLGKPVLVMRNATERKEKLSNGCIKLVGTNENDIYHEAARLLSDCEYYKKAATSSLVFGDGYASVRIADVLENLKST